MRITVVHVVAEGDAAISAALGLLVQAVTGQPVSLPAASVTPPALPAAPAKRKAPLAAPKADTAQAGKHDAAILKALAFRPLTLTEIAGALCRDKREVPKMAPRLHGVLKRLVRDGQVARQGKEYAATSAVNERTEGRHR